MCAVFEMGLICKANLTELVGLIDPMGKEEVLIFKTTGQYGGILCDECARDREPRMVFFRGSVRVMCGKWIHGGGARPNVPRRRMGSWHRGQRTVLTAFAVEALGWRGSSPSRVRKRSYFFLAAGLSHP
jgi:hypothetical protein